MMGSPKFVIQMPILVASICIAGTLLSTDYGRKLFVKYKKEHIPGKTGYGYSTSKIDAKAYFNELDTLRKENVQPIWDEKKEPVKD